MMETVCRCSRSSESTTSTAWEMIELDFQRLTLQFDSALGDPGHVEQIIDEAGQMGYLALDDFNAEPCTRLVVGHGRKQSAGVLYRRQRIAQLVREHRQEFIFLAVRVLQGIARSNVNGDVAEITNDAMAAIRQPDTIDLPFVDFGDAAVEPLFSPLRHQTWLARLQGVAKDAHELIGIARHARCGA